MKTSIMSPMSVSQKKIAWLIAFSLFLLAIWLVVSNLVDCDSLLAYQEVLWSLAVSPDERRFLTNDSSGDVLLRAIQTGKTLKRFPARSSTPVALVLSDASPLASALRRTQSVACRTGRVRNALVLEQPGATIPTFARSASQRWSRGAARRLAFVGGWIRDRGGIGGLAPVSCLGSA